MALDPSISLNVRPAQIESPLEQYGKVLSLRNAIQQGQIGQQQLQAGQMENQQRAMDLQDQQVARQAYMESGGDLDQFQRILMQRGASPKMVTQIGQQILTTKKTLAETSKVELENKKALNDAFGSEAQALLNIPDPAQRQTYYQQQTRPKLANLGVPQSQLPPELPQGDEFLQLHANSAKSADQLFQEAMKTREDQRQSAIAPAQQAEATAKASTAGLELAGRTVENVTDQASWNAWRNKLPDSVKEQVPEQFSADAKAQVRRQAVGVKDQPEFDINSYKARMGLVGNSEYDQYLAQYAKSLGKTPAQLTPEEGLASFSKYAESKQDPVMRGLAMAQKNLAMTLQKIQIEGAPTQADAKMLADDIVNHRLAPDQITQIRGRGNGGLGIMIEREIKQMDPKFSWEQSSAEYQLSKSPAFQQNVRYMDSVSESIPMVIDRAQKLANGGVKAVNALVNAGKSQFNDIDLKKFNTDRLLVADEIAKILQGGGTGAGTSDAKLSQAAEILSRTDSPAAIAAALGDVKELIGFRRKALTRGTYMENAQPAETTSQPQATHRYNPATGRIEAK